MNARHGLIGAILALTAVAPALPAQEPTAPESRAQASIDDLIEQLGDDEYQVRKAATKKLAELGQKAVDDLRMAAEDHDDPEVRMRAGRILGRIQRAGALDRDGGLRTTRRPMAGREDLRKMVDEMLRERFDGMFRQRFPEYQRLFDRAMKDVDFDFDLRFDPGMVDKAQDSSSESVSIQIGPDGVRCEVESGEDGESETKVYEAPDVETFRKEHPEIAKKYLDGGKSGFGFRTFDLSDEPFFGTAEPFKVELKAPTSPFRFDPEQAERWNGGWRTLNPRWSDETEMAPAPGKGRVLGVQVDALHPAVADFLGFEPGQGLQVDSVQAESLASDLGIRVGDVLLEIGDTPIHARGDVATALGAIEAGKTVEVVVNRRGREVELEATKRDSAEDPAEPDAVKKPKALRRR